MPRSTFNQHLSEITDLRHRLHTIAELSGHEKKTADTIRRFLKKNGADEVATGIGGQGILATFKGEKNESSILLRAELDALPIPERAEDIDYISRNEGVAHKCGHDGHMAILCGVAKSIGESKSGRGTVYLLFQPSEETGEGAKRVLDDSRVGDLDPDYCFALHNLPGYPEGQIVVRDGVFAAASLGLIVSLQGSTSHAASPEQGNSPAPALAHLIESFSSIPQYKIPIGSAARVTVVHARLGERAFGTSPADAVLMATLRTFDDNHLDTLRNHCLQLVRGVAESRRLEFHCETTERFSATVNHREAVSVVRRAADRAGFPLIEKKEPFGWSEDFGRFTDRFRGALFGLGAGEDQPPLHAESYDFPDAIIPAGVEMFMNIIDTVGSGRE